MPQSTKKKQNVVDCQQLGESTAIHLPPKVLPWHGVNKYIVIRGIPLAESKNKLWFVRRASPEECGGPCHGNVAQPLLQQLESLGYITCMGGGRIDLAENEDVFTPTGLTTEV